MKSVGIKSLVWLALYVFLLFATVFAGTIDLDFFTNTDIRLAFGLGLFATFLTIFIFKGFRLDEVSATALHYIPPKQELFGTRLIDYKGHKISITTNVRAAVYEFGAFTKGILVFASFLLMGIWTIQFRQLNHLLTVDEKSYLGKPHYCKIDEKDEKEEAKSRPECRLIVRAFELGYAKDLGNCGKKEDEKPELCELQHKDEPDMHFAYRLAKRFYNNATKGVGEKSLDDVKNQFKKDVDNYQSMLGLLKSDINNEPASGHFIFTTLANPSSGLGLAFENFLRPSHCVRWYSKMPNLPEKQNEGYQNSHYLEHSLGHLLFDTSYPRGVAHCSEVKIQWGIPESVCSDLMNSPQKVLTNYKLDEGLDQVIAYYEQKKKIRSNLKYRTPGEFASFNCLSYGANKDELVQQDVTYKGQKIAFRWYKMAAMSNDTIASISFFKNSARLLAPGFDYGLLQTKSSPSTSGAPQITEDLFAPEDFRMARLGFLRDADIFIGSSWLENRADIMEVYPYYLHLKSFVEVFRIKYRETRGSFQ